MTPAAAIERLEGRVLLSAALFNAAPGVAQAQPSLVAALEPQKHDPAPVDPSASISAPDVTTASTSPETVTITYTSSAAIDSTTIATSNITVSGPAGALQVTGATVNSTSGGDNGQSNSLTAAYTVAGPSGGWAAADNGAYTVSLQPNQVKDVNGTAIPATQGTFNVNIAAADTTAPTATISAPALSTAGGSNYQFTITYSDDTAVDASTVATGNVTVTAPGGSPQLSVTAATVDNNTNGTPRTVTYTVSAPHGTWSAADNGAYTITLNANQVRDTSGNAAAATSTTFSVNIAAADTTPPTATITAPNVTSPGGASEAVSVTYSDNVAVNVSTINAQNVIVTGPHGPLNVSGVHFSANGNGSPITVTYTVDAPGGSWQPADNGTYTVAVVAGSVQDTSGNGVAATSATFTVNATLPDTTPPSAQIQAPSITTGGGSSETITIVYTDDVAVNAASIGPGNITITGPSGPLAVTAAQASGGNGSPLVATYVVAAPHGTWSSADNGSYVVTVNANQVSDTSGNFVSGASGSFAVNIPAPVNNGPPDLTFANGQTVSTRFVTEAIITQSDGRVLAVGHQGNLAAGASQGVIERFNSDGSIDSGFGNQGMIVSRSGINEAYFAVTMPDANHFIVAGTSGGDFVLARYDLSGNLDPSFGTGGRVITDFGTTTDAARGVAMAPGGMIVAAGDSGGNFAFARYDPAGHLDANFAQSGRQMYGLGSGNNGLGAVAVQPDGKIVAAGSEGGSVVVVRLTAAGEADGTFGSGGLATVGPLAARQDLGTPDRSEGLAIQSNGDILVANRTATGHFGVARLNPNGNLDTTFGTNGLTTANFGGDDDADSIVLQDNGPIIVIGTTSQGTTPQTAVAAFDPNGNPLTNFGSNGLLTLPSGLTPIGRALHVGDILLRAFGTRTPDGRVVIGTTDEALAATTSSSLRRLIVPGAVIAQGSGRGTPEGSFGIVNGKRKKLTFRDQDGTIITLTLAGGTGMAFLAGDRVSLTIDDLGKGVVLTITGRGGDGRISLADVTISGTLRSMNARNSDLFGTLHVTGAIGNLALGNVSGTIWSGDAIANVSGGDLSGNLFATTTLERMKFARVSGTIASGGGVIGTLMAASLDNARVLSGANLGADGMVGGDGANADTYGAGAIGSIKVRGTITSSFIGAGVNPVDQTFGNNDDVGVGGPSSAIRSLAARGADNASRFEAGAFGRVKLPATVDVLHDPRFRILS